MPVPDPRASALIRGPNYYPISLPTARNRLI